MQVRLQRPTVTAEMSLMLAIAKFFITGFSLGSTTPTAFHTSDLLLKGMPMPAHLGACTRLLRLWMIIVINIIVQ